MQKTNKTAISDGYLPSGDSRPNKRNFVKRLNIKIDDTAHADARLAALLAKQTLQEFVIAAIDLHTRKKPLKKQNNNIATEILKLAHHPADFPHVLSSNIEHFTYPKIGMNCYRVTFEVNCKSVDQKAIEKYKNVTP